ncbi:MAG: type I-C CRISPR-associated protein Cas8c/Csd1 [Deltaproteobacteria bacterium]|nr:type I-C CRISPR-associated protein Cas8c/Csd1 [Deltaproteobacteria bacterium]
MILSALADYYQRLAADPSTDIAPPGFEQKPIDYLIIIDRAGNFLNLRDIREGTGKNKKGRVSLVPKSVKRTVGIAANLLWDSAPYVLGKALPDEAKDSQKLASRALEQHRAFVEKIKQTFAGITDEGLLAVNKFMENGDFSPVFDHILWPEIEKDGGNISFMLQDDSQLICQRPAVVSALLAKTNHGGVLQTCSVTGGKDVPAELHTSIKGVWGAQSSGANIVSFNLDAFRSFGKHQGHNAPVGQHTEFAYTTALNYLLASETQRMQVGDASTVFWAKEPCEFEKDFLDYLSPKKGEEAVDYSKIKNLLSAVRTGIPPTEAAIPFYVLGLAPNASRISIRFWYEGNVRDIKERIVEHFQDIELIRAPHDPLFPSLFQLLVSTALEGKSDKIPPNLGGDLARSVLAGTIYPRTLFANAVRRCKAEQTVGFARASIIKGFLARNARISKTKQKEVSVALDKTFDNTGYVLGRLFAVLERIQEQAQGPGLNKTIRDTYFSAATSSPLVTFNRLNQLSVHHLAKIRNAGKNTIWLEQIKQEVFRLLPSQGIPSILSLEDQGRFTIGYYHQRQDFFTKKETEEEGVN